MRRLLKLLKQVAIGVLLAVGSNQVFAVQASSDELHIFVGGIEANPFSFFESTNGPPDLYFNTLTNSFVPLPTPLFVAIFDGRDLGNSTSTRFAALTELGAPEGTISDILRLDIVTTAATPVVVARATFTFTFLDNVPPADFGGCSASNVKCISEDGTAQDLTGLLFPPGTVNPTITVTLMSDIEAIPEPEIYTMIGIGLALIGFVARRRK